MNLTHNTPQLRGARRFVTAAACTAIAFGTCASALALHLNVSTQDAAPTSQVPHISGGVLAGNRLSFVQPVYPPEAKAAGIAGTVILSARIGKDGQIASLQVVSGPPELTKAAWAAVKQWTYKPYLHNGQPVEVDTTITVNFSLSSDSAPGGDHAASEPDTSASAVTHPILIKHAKDPVFPSAEKRKGAFDGTVLVSLTVNKDGMPTNVTIKKGLAPDFDQSALEAVKQYRFKPAMVDGDPVSTNLYVGVRFQKF